MQTQAEMTPKERIADVMQRHGLTITSEFVPFSKSRNAQPREDGKVWRSLNWRVTLHKARAASSAPGTFAIMTTDYSAGEGNCPAYKASVKALGNRDSIMRREAIDWEIEHGKACVCADGGRPYPAAGAPTLKPDACDVIYSLVRDADVLDCGTFEEWASDLGYDTDSRKAEATYRACLEIALKLRNGLGESVLAELREAAQDY